MTDQLTVPATVLANIRRRWPDIAEPWAAQVGTEFRTLCDRYQATPREVLPARYGFVTAVDTPHGPLVLRSSPDPHGADQAAVATALANLDAAPRVHEAVTTDHGTWTVIDRVLPGTPLSQVAPATVDPQALFAPLAAMRDQPPPRLGMPSIFDWLRERLEDDQLIDLRPGTTIAPVNERQTALALLDDLARGHAPALCHGDASSGNIIASGPTHWAFIDPRGVTGEHTYDVAVLAIRVTAAFPASEIRTYIAELAQVSPARLDAWMAVAQAARV
ncbi:aminoglycoside phosphotransferase family protein [Actinoplanes hulinensis]|uniref:Aminoglycoside phosphotransferase family protein n=1 Tax=Actinoplanes hulinensis TaxID=1144547 RepID=A0ABS7BAG1_9ACTN|nr:aminoglycoside phosphotransferase family protein [Actinoplanes hulinensis]MBW6437674.1 aminoglycoside phosphotransferase family protein [Actinoplanes hulinensis]